MLGSRRDCGKISGSAVSFESLKNLALRNGTPGMLLV